MQNVLVTGRKGKRGPVAARLFVILARKAHTAVIFRRGPSKWVQLIKWDTAHDTFEFGQWFRGRIYERRCDLSPDGKLLIYFAQKISARTLKDKEYTYAWTAISRPPYFTALALWPKADCWDGGGSFHSNRAVLLNHAAEAVPHPNHKPPGWMHITQKNTARGEDEPIFSDRLKRDGWNETQEWKVEYRGPSKYYHTVQPGVLERANRSGEYFVRVTRSIERFDYAEAFSVRDRKNLQRHPIERASWADWDHRSRLVFARDGKIFSDQLAKDGSWSETELADFSSSKPTPLPPPAHAMKW